MYPLSINAFFNGKTLDFRIENQAFLVFMPPQYFYIFSIIFHVKNLIPHC
jgi:hypothetical protein